MMTMMVHINCTTYCRTENGAASVQQAETLKYGIKKVTVSSMGYRFCWVDMKVASPFEDVPKSWKKRSPQSQHCSSPQRFVWFHCDHAVQPECSRVSS